jgi:hypothetical protein
MHQDYVVLFRQTRPLSETELAERSQATRRWAEQVNAAGHALDPRILGSTARSGGDAATPVQLDGPAVTALLFLKAGSLDEAYAIAHAHPAVGYGARIEVRPSAAPASAS